MKCEKINNYKLTGSIHTLQIKSMDIPDVPPQLQRKKLRMKKNRN